MSITFTSSDLDKLKAALISGVLEVQIGDRRIKYNSRADLIKAINTIEKALNGDNPVSPNVVPTYSKGES